MDQELKEPIKMPFGGHCWLEMSDKCYGCALYGTGSIDACQHRINVYRAYDERRQERLKNARIYADIAATIIGNQPSKYEAFIMGMLEGQTHPSTPWVKPTEWLPEDEFGYERCEPEGLYPMDYVAKTPKVYVITRDGKHTIDYRVYRKELHAWTWFHTHDTDKVVLAWMPIPELTDELKQAIETND